MSQASSQTGVELTSTAYCDETGTYRAEYDRDTTAASMAVVTTVSQFLGVPPTDMAPLQHTVDTGALDSLSLERPGGGTVLTTFVYEGCEVSVSTEGGVIVSPPDGDGIDPDGKGQDPDGSVSR